jgi:hypothetical protein
MSNIDYENYTKFINFRLKRLFDREVQVISLKNEVEKSEAINICRTLLIDSLTFSIQVIQNEVLDTNDLVRVLIKSDEFTSWLDYAKIVLNKYSSLNNTDTIEIYSPVDGELEEYPNLKQIRLDTEWKYSLEDLIRFLTTRYWLSDNSCN